MKRTIPELHRLFPDLVWWKRRGFKEFPYPPVFEKIQGKLGLPIVPIELPAHLKNWQFVTSFQDYLAKLQRDSHLCDKYRHDVRGARKSERERIGRRFCASIRAAGQGGGAFSPDEMKTLKRYYKMLQRCIRYVRGLGLDPEDPQDMADLRDIFTDEELMLVMGDDYPADVSLDIILLRLKEIDKAHGANLYEIAPKTLRNALSKVT